MVQTATERVGIHQWARWTSRSLQKKGRTQRNWEIQSSSFSGSNNTPEKEHLICHRRKSTKENSRPSQQQQHPKLVALFSEYPKDNQRPPKNFINAPSTKIRLPIISKSCNQQFQHLHPKQV